MAAATVATAMRAIARNLLWRDPKPSNTAAGTTRPRLDHGTGRPGVCSLAGSSPAIWAPLVVIVTESLAGTALAATVAGLNWHWLSDGRPEQVKLTGPLRRPWLVTWRPSEPDCPCLIVRVFALPPGTEWQGSQSH